MRLVRLTYDDTCDRIIHPTQLFMECAPGKCPSLARTNPEGEQEQAQAQEGEEGPRLCSNTAIQARRFPPTEVFKVRPWVCCSSTAPWIKPRNNPHSSIYLPSYTDQTCDRGWALRTAAPARKGAVLIEYLGEVVTMEEGQARMRRMTGQHDFYFASLEAGLLLDAGPMGSDARFAKCVLSQGCGC